MNNKKVRVSVLGILGIVLATIGVTYAFFSYSKTGTKENVIKTGAITFLYTEVDGIGNGLGINDAMPMTDAQGKAQSNYFDFKITSKKNNNYKIPYTVTARMSNQSDDIGSVVKVYLTDDNNNEIEAPKLYSGLTQYTNSSIDVSGYTEKIIYQGNVPVSSTNYEKNFRLRMWIDENADYLANDYNNKTFVLTVNVYAEGKIKAESDVEEERNTQLSVVNINNQELEKVTGENYDYEVKLAEGTTQANLVIQAKNPNARVTVTETNSNYAYIGEVEESKIKKLSTGIQRTLSVGDTRYKYYKITVVSEDGTKTTNYKLKVKVLKTYNSVDSVDASFSQDEKKAVIACVYDTSNLTFIDCDTYDSLQTAVNSKTNSYIFPTADYQTSSYVEVPEGKIEIIDLNGKTLKFNGMMSHGDTWYQGILTRGTLTMMDSKTGGNMISDYTYYVSLGSAGSLYVKSGIYHGQIADDPNSFGTSGYINITGGTFMSHHVDLPTIFHGSNNVISISHAAVSNDAGGYTFWNESDNKMKIQSCSVTCSHCVVNDSAGTINISSSSIIADTYEAVYNNNGGTINICSGTIKGKTHDLINRVSSGQINYKNSTSVVSGVTFTNGRGNPTKQGSNINGVSSLSCS